MYNRKTKSVIRDGDGDGDDDDDDDDECKN
jgi:hypothetical protein